ncbi:MAG: hypothetical protein ACREMH_10505, partial [Gemmatimonadales bacterium]
MRDRLDALLRSGEAVPRTGDEALERALIETKAALGALRDVKAATERSLAAERRALDDAARRGRLAAEAGDVETAGIAQEFTARHSERAAMLERKLAVQAEEVALAEREVEELMARWRAASRGAGRSESSLDAAWRELEAAGAPGRTGPSAEDEQLR